MWEGCHMKQEHIDQIEAASKAIEERVKDGKATHVYFVACGGSQAAMMPAQYMFDRELDVPSAIYTSNEFNYATPKAFDSSSIVITISHSGTTPETVAAAQKATDAGALSIAFSNAVDSPLWNAASYPIHYDHGDGADEADKSGSVELRAWFEFLKSLDAEHAERWAQASQAVDALPALKAKAADLYRDACVKFASRTKRSKLIYTMGSGASYGEMYSLAICWLMEMQWVNSNCIHSGEYFHGPFEITDFDVPFIISVGNGATKHLDERALAFAKQYSQELLVLDENAFSYEGVPQDVQEYFAPELLSAAIRVFVEAHAHDSGHSLSVRRYMWQLEY